MFEQYTVKPPQRLAGYAFFSVAAHVLVISALVVVAGAKAKEKLKNVAAVQFVHAKAAAPPPPPPPPARHATVQHKTQIIPTRVDPKPIEIPKEQPPKEEPPKEKEPEEAGEEGGMEGGVKGGVKGGVVGGLVGGVVGSTGDATQVKPKNVPAFKIQADAISQPQPRLSEVFIQSHRSTGPIAGMYRVCVGLDGHVFQVTPVKSVPGADDDIVNGIKDGWVYKPQQVPVCFLYNMPIIIRQ